MSKPRVLLIGAGGHCRSCIDVIEAEGLFEIGGIVDKDTVEASDILGYRVIGADDDLPKLKSKYDYALVTVGQIKSSAVRGKLVRLLGDAGFQMPVIVSPVAQVSKHAELGEGTIVMHGAMVNAGAKIGRNCIINSRSLIEHDAEIGDCVHISTGAIVNGGTRVGNNSFIGSGAVLVHGITLPDYSFVRAGRLVVSEKDFQILEHN